MQPNVEGFAEAEETTEHKQLPEIILRPLRPDDLGSSPEFLPVRGTLENGINKLYAGHAPVAVGIWKQLQPGSLDRKLLGWTIAMSGRGGIPARFILETMEDLPDWPGHEYMAENFEVALVREGRTDADIIRLLGGRELRSFRAAIALADAYLAYGKTEIARTTLAPFWWRERLDAKTQSRLAAKFETLLTVDDHRKRMHTAFYEGRWREGRRMAALSEQYSLARAREATVRRRSNASKLIETVEPESRTDPAFLFTRIANARHKDEYELAASLLVDAPRDPAVLIDPDEWWDERRIVSRAILDDGKPELAYEIAAEHSAQSAGAIADAEFHAGWYALRFLHKPLLARQHFRRLVETVTTPISLSRGYYWLGRTYYGEKRSDYFRKAAQHQGTFYGQLAAQALGQHRLALITVKPTLTEKHRFDRNEMVVAIRKLEKIGYPGRAKILYQHLAETIERPGEIKLLSDMGMAEYGPPYGLRLAKLAYYQGLPVETVAWPTGAIPRHARIGNSGKALAYAVARQESGFNKSAVSPANARGLLQLLPGTAREVAKDKGMPYSFSRLTTDAAYNATLGAAYLAKQMRRFDDSYILTIAGYNAGPSRSIKWMKNYGDPRGQPIEEVVDWIERIPFYETRNYVQRIMENYQVYKAQIGGSPLDIVGDLRFGRRGEDPAFSGGLIPAFPEF